MASTQLASGSNPIQIDDNFWSSVFVDVNRACDSLAGHALNMANDSNLWRSVGGVTMDRFRHTALDNGYKACHDLLLTKGRPHSELRAAMIEFCRSREDLHHLLQPHLRPQEVIRAVSVHPDCQTLPQFPPPASESTPSPHHLGSPENPHRGSLSQRLLQRAARTAGSTLRRLQITDSNPFGRSRLALTDKYHRLPRHIDCLGRDSDIENLVSTLLQQGSLNLPPACCILGPPAIGKTTLASTVIHHKKIHRKYRCLFWVSLEACTSVANFHNKVGEVLPIDKPSWNACLSYLSGASALLALDNFETLWNYEEFRSETEASLRDLSQRSSILMTIQGTRLPALMREWALKIQLKTLGPKDAASVFCLHTPEFKNDPDLEGLLRDCDGLPLAVSLLSRAADPNLPLRHLRQLWDEKRTALFRHGNSEVDNLPISLNIALGQPSLRENGPAWSVLRLLACGVVGDELARLLSGPGLPRDPGALWNPNRSPTFDLARVMSPGLLWGHGLERASYRDWWNDETVSVVSALDVLAKAGLVVWENDAFRLLEPVRTYVTDEFTCPSTTFLEEWRQNLPATQWCHRSYLEEFYFASPIKSLSTVCINNLALKYPSFTLVSISFEGMAIPATKLPRRFIDSVSVPHSYRSCLVEDAFLGFRKARLMPEDQDTIPGSHTPALEAPTMPQRRFLVLHRGSFSVRFVYKLDPMFKGLPSRSFPPKGDVIISREEHGDLGGGKVEDWARVGLRWVAETMSWTFNYD